MSRPSFRRSRIKACSRSSIGAFEGLTWHSLADDLWLNAKRNCIPITGTFELTPLCNFRCRMCYVRLDADQMSSFGRLHSVDEWLDLARQAKDLGTYNITLSGGEPLMHPQFEEIYTGLSRMGIMVLLLSNGSLITDRHIEMFRQYPLASARFTLYGASNETYERLCGAPRGFDRVMQSIKALLDADMPFSLSYTMTTENVDDFDAVMDIARELDIPITIANDLNLAVRGAKSDAENLRVDPDKRPSINPKDQYRPAKRDEAVEKARAEGLLTGIFQTCRTYRTYFFIDWNGTMENCASMSYCKSRPFEVGFAEACSNT